MHLPYTKDCFVCGAHNEHGLHLRFRREGDEVRAEFIAQPHLAGFRGLLHGGVIATVLDEAMFWAAASTRRKFCLAAELSVRYIKKVSTGQPLMVIARFEKDRGRLWESSALLRDAEDVVCARASCKQVPMSLADMKNAAFDFFPDPETMEGLKLFIDR